MWLRSNKSRGRGKGRGNFGRSDTRRFEKAQVQCYTYGKQGHYSWECFSKNEEVTKLVEVDEGVVEPTLLLSAKEEPKGGNNAWCLDNGASNHMIGDRSKFVELQTNVTGIVCFGDNAKVEIKGKGLMLFKTTS